MDFTRDPIIETIISPKDGYKLSVRNSRGPSQEEYLVNALEVVSFGSALFLRSLEKPKPFLLPIADYEIVEVKEARMVLKNVSLDKPIKIGESKEAKASSEDKEGVKAETENKKSSKKKNSRKRKSKSEASNSKEAKDNPKKVAKKEPETPSKEGGDEKDEVEPSSSVTPRVFPTPPKIIGRKLPTPENEELPTSDVLSDEPVTDIEIPNEESLEDNHHDKMSHDDIKVETPSGNEIESEVNLDQDKNSEEVS